MALKDLGYDNVQIIFSDPKNSPQLLDEEGEPKSGTAFVDGKGVRTIIINAEDPKNSTRSELIGTLTEEGSHIIGKIEGRQIATGTDEKGLESTGRATNEYFQNKYKGDDTAISIQSDGKDYSNVDFGENVGDSASSVNRGRLIRAIKNADKKLRENHKDKNQYFSVLSEVGKYAGHRVGSPYEVLYMISKEGRKNILDDNNNLDLQSFDPEGWKRVEGRKEYKEAVESVKIKAKNIALSTLRENPDIKFFERRSNGDIVSGFKLEGSEKIIDKNIANKLEFALGSPVITGTAIINKTKQSDGSINLKISVRYNLSDEFGDVYGTREAQKKLWKKLGLKDMPQLIPSEYGTPYGMLGPSETDEIFSQRFKSEKEYLNFLKGKN